MLFEALKALLVGLVEGITEWLPISSTGHMILVDEFVQLDVSAEFLELFLVVIQIGAILAVILLYFQKLNPWARAKGPAERRATWRLWGMVAVGCVPAMVFGLALDDWVNERFYNAWTVAAMLVLYGLVFIVVERRRVGRHALLIESVDDIDWRCALKIGFFQVLAIVPGTSRSGATIIGGMLSGCTRTAAAEFTFFLAIPVMFGWGLLKTVKYALALGLAFTSTELVVLAVGVVSAFVVSVLSIKFLMGYIKTNTFIPFGIYRILIGLTVLAYFAL